jgi:hypothetical protein
MFLASVSLCLLLKLVSLIIFGLVLRNSICCLGRMWGLLPTSVCGLDLLLLCPSFLVSLAYFARILILIGSVLKTGPAGRTGLTGNRTLTGPVGVLDRSCN